MLKESQRQERAAFILQTAEEVLLQKGYAAMSMDDIAARAGIAKGTLYLHFATKDELVFRLLERDLQRMLRMIEDNVTMEGSARDRLTRILDSLYQGLIRQTWPAPVPALQQYRAQERHAREAGRDPAQRG